MYLAEDTKLDRKAASNLDHLNIVTIHQVSKCNSRPFFILELVDAQILRDWGEDKELRVIRIIDLALQVCEKAYSPGIVHRDIKSLNMLIDHEGNTVGISDLQFTSGNAWR